MGVIMYKSKDTGFNGILNYIYSNHIEILPKTKDTNQLFSFVKKLQRRFLNENSIKYKRNFEYLATQKNWISFINFLNKTYLL